MMWKSLPEGRRIWKTLQMRSWEWQWSWSSWTKWHQLLFQILLIWKLWCGSHYDFSLYLFSTSSSTSIIKLSDQSISVSLSTEHWCVRVFKLCNTLLQISLNNNFFSEINYITECSILRLLSDDSLKHRCFQLNGFSMFWNVCKPHSHF